ncbi:hypothetical protein [uncultured Litoreibacter sp.]|uniref:hypothetical protein n=1 Tax=uncultured Litoreibacter sp. TaxID=1392394 RepID=UPI0026252973|nr:hypothetical protein [uncultured Litoreibacter sp.]
MIELLVGIVVAALIFSAFLWQLYCAATSTGFARWNAVGLSLATLALMASIPAKSDVLLLLGAGACLLLSPYAIWTTPRWSKLLPMVQLAMGLFVIYLLFFNSNLPAGIT